MEKINYTSRIEEDKVIIDFSEFERINFQITLNLDSLREMLDAANIDCYCHALNEMIYFNAMLTNFILNSEFDEKGHYSLVAPDKDLYFVHLLSEFLKEINPCMDRVNC
jgi:hypothetical protein